MIQTKPKVNDVEYAVLEQLAQHYSSDANCLYFRSLVESTSLELKQVRRACRSLAKKGLAEYMRGLFDEDGMVAGSGYCATKAGAAVIDPCDVCGDLACYDYDGKKECEQHYGKAPNKLPL